MQPEKTAALVGCKDHDEESVEQNAARMNFLVLDLPSIQHPECQLGKDKLKVPDSVVFGKGCLRIGKSCAGD